MTDASRNTPRRLVAFVAVLIGLAGCAAVAVNSIDHMVVVEQSDLYRQDIIGLEVAGDRTVTQTFRAADLERVDALVHAESGDAVLRLELAEGGEPVEVLTTRVPKGDTPQFVSFEFDARSGSHEYRATFGAATPDDVIVLAGSACDCVRSGEFVAGADAADSGVADLHLGTFRDASRVEQYRLLRDRLGAYAPGVLSFWLVLASAVGAALLLCWICSLLVAEAGRNLSRVRFAGALVLVVVPIWTIVWWSRPG